MLCVDHQQERNIELGCWPFREAQDSEVSWQERAEAHVPTDTCSADQIAKPAVGVPRPFHGMCCVDGDHFLGEVAVKNDIWVAKDMSAESLKSSWGD